MTSVHWLLSATSKMTPREEKLNLAKKCAPSHSRFLPQRGLLLAANTLKYSAPTSLLCWTEIFPRWGPRGHPRQNRENTWLLWQCCSTSEERDVHGNLLHYMQHYKFGGLCWNSVMSRCIKELSSRALSEVVRCTIFVTTLLLPRIGQRGGSRGATAYSCYRQVATINYSNLT